MKTWPSMPSPTGIVMPRPVLRTVVPRLQAVSRLQADGPHTVVADLLRDLGGDEDRLTLELGFHLEREVDLGQGVGGELDVDHRAGDGDDAAVLELGRLRWVWVGGHGHGVAPVRRVVSCRAT